MVIKRHLNARSLIHKGETAGGDSKILRDTPYKFQPICLKVISINYIFSYERILSLKAILFSEEL